MTTREGRSIGSDEQVDLACFEVGGRQYALEVAELREIVRMQKITPLPLAPELIEGVIDLRGVVVPVLDLGRALGEAPVGEGASARIAVLENRGLRLGLCVHAATEVIAVESDRLEEPPELATRAGYEVIRAVVRRAEADPVMVLSLDHLLERVRGAPAPREAEDA